MSNTTKTAREIETENAAAELRAAIMGAPLPEGMARDSRAEASAAMNAERTYAPRKSILTTDQLKAKARIVGPLLFSQLVNEYEAAAQTARRSPAPGTAAAALGQYKYTEEGKPVPETPYTFAAMLARKVAKGEAFYEDIDLEAPVAKGGTMSEWLFNAARYLNTQADKGALERAALGQDIRAALALPGNGLLK